MRTVRKKEVVDKPTEITQPQPEVVNTTDKMIEETEPTLAEIIASAPTTHMLQTKGDFNARYWLFMERLCKTLGLPVPNGILCPPPYVLERLNKP